MKCSEISLFLISSVFSVVKHMFGRSGDQTGGARLSRADRHIDANKNSFVYTTTPKKV